MKRTKTNAKEDMPIQNHAESDDHSNRVRRRFAFKEGKRGGFKEWGRQDALKALRDEFWEKDPGRDETSRPNNNPNSTIDAGHPDYDLYTRIETLIHAHYDEIYDEIEAGIIRDAQNGDPDNEAGAWTGTETSLIRKTVDQLKDAVAAVRSGGYKKMDGHDVDWKELLPSQEEIILCRFVDPYGVMHATIFRLIAIMGVEWMGSI
ncbi:hypothetical protein CEP54_002561 [Fusarium duplospermum]|uniref:Uncharacterized protein n=1 Tax=Fusarium duplospermum TaxID=1325734 RepID=A0A428QUF0_9HYPO|nr:hypothetical protein CEP54_002561 [Fusarium duplospermum]